MFDLSNPQQRERVLVVIAGIALCFIVMLVLPGQFGELTRLDRQRKNLENSIEDLKRHDRIKDDVRERLRTMESQAIADSGSARNMAELGYQQWLLELARNVGIGGDNAQIRPSTAAGVRDIYNKVVYTLEGEGRLDQIAEFLRRFHRTDYLHLMTNVSPRPSPRNPNVFTVTFRIEVLVLPQVRVNNVPRTDEEITAITDEERQMLATIRERAILSAYTPPPPDPPPPTPTPPRLPFDETPYCVVTAIVMVDDRPQCWINHRPAGRMYHLFEEESFMLEGIRATIKKIEMNAQRIQVAAAGGIYAINLGKSFADAEAPSYFFTGIVEENGNPWTAESVGEPHCVIVHGSLDGNGNLAEKVKHVLSAGESFPMAEVSVIVRNIDPVSNQIQMEAAGVVYTIRAGSDFAEFSNE